MFHRNAHICVQAALADAEAALVNQRSAAELLWRELKAARDGAVSTSREMVLGQQMVEEREARLFNSMELKKLESELLEEQAARLEESEFLLVESNSNLEIELCASKVALYLATGSEPWHRPVSVPIRQWHQACHKPWATRYWRYSTVHSPWVGGHRVQDHRPTGRRFACCRPADHRS